VQGRRLIPRIARLFRAYRWQVAAVLVMILVTAGLGVAPSLLTKVVFDQALFPPNGQRDLHLLYILVGVMVAIPLVAAVISVGQTYLTTVVGQRVMQDLRNRLYEHLQSMSLRFFTGTRTGELQSRLQNDVGGVQNVVTNTASSGSATRNPSTWTASGHGRSRTSRSRSSPVSSPRLSAPAGPAKRRSPT
jgi:ATP-binding cassette subfamily B protein